MIFFYRFFYNARLLLAKRAQVGRELIKLARRLFTSRGFFRVGALFFVSFLFACTIRQSVERVLVRAGDGFVCGNCIFE